MARPRRHRPGDNRRTPRRVRLVAPGARALRVVVVPAAMALDVAHPATRRTCRRSLGHRRRRPPRCVAHVSRGHVVDRHRRRSCGARRRLSRGHKRRGERPVTTSLTAFSLSVRLSTSVSSWGRRTAPHAQPGRFPRRHLHFVFAHRRFRRRVSLMQWTPYAPRISLPHREMKDRDAGCVRQASLRVWDGGGCRWIFDSIRTVLTNSELGTDTCVTQGKREGEGNGMLGVWGGEISVAAYERKGGYERRGDIAVGGIDSPRFPFPPGSHRCQPRHHREERKPAPTRLTRRNLHSCRLWRTVCAQP